MARLYTLTELSDDTGAPRTGATMTARGMVEETDIDADELDAITQLEVGAFTVLDFTSVGGKEIKVTRTE